MGGGDFLAFATTMNLGKTQSNPEENTIEKRAGNQDYDIIYDANGGQNAPAADKAIAGMDWPIPDAEPTWDEHHRFLGWSEDSSASSPTWTKGQNIANVNRNYTLYAVWQVEGEPEPPQPATEYTISIRVTPAGAGTASGEGEYAAGTSVTLTATPVAGGEHPSTFLEWVKPDGGRESSSSITIIVGESDATYTAVFSADTDARLIYDANGGSGAPATAQYFSELGTPIEGPNPTYPDHVFLGWATSANASQPTLMPGATYGRGAGAGDHTIYAVWMPASGNIENFEHAGDKIPSIDQIASCAASWRINSYTVGSLVASGTVSWDITAPGYPDYEVSTVEITVPNYIAVQGSGETGSVNINQWNVDSPPNKVKAVWVNRGERREVSVFVTEEDEIGEEAGCTAVIKESGAVQQSPGRFADGTGLSLVATAAEGWEFVAWKKSGEQVSTAKTYNFVVSEETAGEYEALFKNANPDYTVTITIDPPEAGQSAGEVTAVTVSGNGTYKIGDTVSLSATDGSNYSFTQWKAVYDGMVFKENPYTFTLSREAVTTSLEWVAECKESGLFQVLTRVNDGSFGRLTKTVDGHETSEIAFPANTSLTLTATPTLQGRRIACVEIRASNEGNLSVTNQNLAYQGFNGTLTHTYTVISDETWTAYFVEYATITTTGVSGVPESSIHFDYQCNLLTIKGGIKAAMNVYPGYSYGFVELLPEPRREGYYLHGWYTGENGSGTQITNDTPVPDDISRQSFTLYAHWTPDSNKYYVTAICQPALVGECTINSPKNGEYFVAGEECSIDVTKSDSDLARKYLYQNSQVKVDRLWKIVSKESLPFVFTIGADPTWAYDIDESDDSKKQIDVRIGYKDSSVRVTTSEVPEDGSLGYVDPIDSTYPPGERVTVSAHIRDGTGAYLSQWEKQENYGTWNELTQAAVYHTVTVTVPEPAPESTPVTQLGIRMVFSLHGILHYNTDGGSVIEDQTYSTNLAFNLTSTVPTKSGFAFIGWSESSQPQYLPSASVTFAETEKTLTALWYATPQAISEENIRHWDLNTDSAYEGETALVSAQVSDIRYTGTLGKLAGTLTWTVTMPDTSQEEAQAKFVKISVGDNGDFANILTSSEKSNTNGETVTFSYEYQIEESWTFTVYYSVGDLFVTYHPNGGEGGPNTQGFTRGEPFTIPYTEPTREGYVFVGWAFEPDANPDSDEMFYPGDTVGTSHGFLLLDNILFYAIWKEGVALNIVHYNDTIDAVSDVSLSDATVIASKNDSDEVSIWWKIANIEKGFSLRRSDSIKVTDAYENILLTGNGELGNQNIGTSHGEPDSNWTATIYYTQEAHVITYDTEGGKPTIPPQKVPIEIDKVRISTLKPKKEGYTFEGWATTPMSIAVEINPGDTIEIKSNITLYAIYYEDSDSSSDESGGGGEESPGTESDTYTVYAKAVDASFGSVSPSEKEYMSGEEISFTATPADGYKLTYWVKDSGGEILSTNLTYTFIGTEADDGETYVAFFTPKNKEISSELIYYVPTGLLMSEGDTLIWDDDGLVGCGDGGSGD